MLNLTVREQNEKVAKTLGVSYTHKLYKEFLQNMQVPFKSLSQVIFYDVYDQKLVGFAAGPLSTSTASDDIRAKGSDAVNDEWARIKPEHEARAMETKRFTQLKEATKPYIDAMIFASNGADIKAVYGIQSTQGRSGKDDLFQSDTLSAYPWLEIICGDKEITGAWMNPKGFGKSFYRL